jgi:hypothetical protein
VTWVQFSTLALGKAVRNNPAVRKEVATAILKALTAPDIAKAADIPPQNIVVRFSEAVDGFKLPEGHDIYSTGLAKKED